MTLSKRITLAGALPILVAFALAVLVAAIALAPSKPTSAIADVKLCDLSPVLLDMLLERQGLNAQQCDTIAADATAEQAADEDLDFEVWDLSGNDGRSLTEFAISDDDAKLLRVLNGGTADTGTAIAETVKYIDLTGNPLTIDDVNFKHIPSTVAVILSADSSVSGFQDNAYTVTEGVASYVAVAFPDLTFDGDESTLEPGFTISGRDAGRTFGDADQPEQMGTHRQLIKFGGGDADVALRTSEINSLADNRIFYLPLTVNKDNDNSDEWDFTLGINAEIDNAMADYELANDEADITVLDADAPVNSVCDRSEDVEAAILNAVGVDNLIPVSLYGSHTKCDDLTLRDLAAFASLTVVDDDDDGKEPIADLATGDLEGLTKLNSLHIIGAGILPSGIFAGVGKDAQVEDDGEMVDSTVQITFAKNNNGGDDDIAEVGKYTPSTIPQHILVDQEAGQVIILDDDLDDDDKGVTKGLDATAYSVTEGSQFFVMTPALQTYYVLDKSAVLVTETTVSTPLITNADDRGNDTDNLKVARYAVSPADDDNGDDESVWLFLFDAAAPENADNLVDLAAVAVADDD